MYILLRHYNATTYRQKINLFLFNGMEFQVSMHRHTFWYTQLKDNQKNPFKRKEFKDPVKMSLFTLIQVTKLTCNTLQMLFTVVISYKRCQKSLPGVCNI